MPHYDPKVLQAEVDSIIDRARQQVAWRLYDQAINSYNLAIEISPHCLMALQGKAAILHRLGRFEELQQLESQISTAEMFAIDAAKGKQRRSTTAPPINPVQAHSDFERGLMYFQQGRHDRALTAFNAALEQNPHSAMAWQYRGIVLSYRGKYEQAVAAFETAINLDANLKDAWIQRGLALDCMARRQAPRREPEQPGVAS